LGSKAKPEDWQPMQVGGWLEGKPEDRAETKVKV
jgi:hypothetical protein